MKVEREREGQWNVYVSRGKSGKYKSRNCDDGGCRRSRRERGEWKVARVHASLKNEEFAKLPVKCVAVLRSLCTLYVGGKYRFFSSV